MNFLLQNIELHLPDDFLIIGEKLLEEEKIIGLHELERHLWLARVEENEVEVQISPSKVRACSCECSDFKNKGLCGHIAAVLFELRKIQQNKKNRTPIRRRAKTAPKKLTVSAIIENAGHEELLTFIRHYAKGNRNFAIALKARFAGVVEMFDNKEKYTQLLDSTINVARKKNDRISFRGTQQLLKISKELMGQADDAIALENYSEGFTILQSLIAKISPILKKSDGNIEDMLAYVQVSFLKLEKILNLNVAPNLIEEIWDFCIVECQKSTYQFSGISYNFYQILFLLCKEKNKSLELLEIIDNELLKTSLTQEFKANLLIMKLKTLEKLGRKKERESIVLENIQTPELLIFVVQNAIEKKEFEKGKFLAKKGFKTIKGAYLKELEELSLKIALEEGDKKSIIKYGRSRFLNTKDLKYFEICKNNFDKDWAEFVKKLLLEINKLPYSLAKRDAIAGVFASEEMLKELLKYIEELKSLELLQIYHETLITSFNKEVQRLYKKLLINYLENHLGRKPSIKIKEIIANLYEKGAHKFAKQLVKFLKTNFSERHSLMEELGVF